MNKRYIDTNVFVRLFTKQPQHQYKKALIFFKTLEEKKQEAYVSILVINEIAWVLGRFYKISRTVYIPKLLKLLLLPNIKIMEVEKNVLIAILEKFQKKKFDFTDIYLAHIATPENIFSFDQDFEKL